MKDKYANFAQLVSSEPEGSYRIALCQRGSAIALIAPHAGRIGVGISEICRSVAGKDLTYYLFEGCKPDNNADLHISSSRFDEPQGLEVAKSAQIVATIIHCRSGRELFINVGGLASQLVYTTTDILRRGGYAVGRHIKPALRGLDQGDICNRGSTGQGLQLELSHGLRRKLIADADEMERFSTVLRAAFRKHIALMDSVSRHRSIQRIQTTDSGNRDCQQRNLCPSADPALTPE
ncbi:poly-gamma-glutamate hydrolase family protein [Uliginosibacterium gangwonense]|uniref:poly-gamma-glutamate hydrolase family protein n=1 Tax=Uliginosibacterium gangwonense TaxID=392736 RepID=UPI000374A83F